MIIETSWDDGSQYDMKLAELLRKYKLPATFYIPSNCELSVEEIKDLAKDFEIGGHTVSHYPDLKKITDKNYLDHEIGDNRFWLQRITGQPINSFCYPKGKYNEETIEAVKEAGFKEARTTNVLQFKPSYQQFRKHTTFHIYNRKEYNGIGWVEFYPSLLKKKPEYLHIWGHSWEIEKFGWWEEVEKLFKEVSKLL